jgi:hypothetical protein
MLKKTVLFFAVGLLVNLYTTFVLTICWNWFVTTAFHVSEISFWVMYGLVLVVSLFQNPYDASVAEDQRWNSALIMIDACVPEDRKQYVKEELEDLKPQMWFEIGSALFGRIVGTTLTLGIAFVVHILASA